METTELYDSIVIGAGLAGLACSIKLQQQGFKVLLLEASDKVGGRVTSDLVDGFILDRGFQVFLSAYPEAARMLDYRNLDLQPFYCGAMIYNEGRFQRLADPFRDPSSLMPMLFSNVAGLGDKLKVAYLRQKVMASSISEIFSQPDTTIAERLKNLGFSSEIIQSFFTPFFGGITLDRSLSGSANMFEFIYKMMAEGQVTLPARGMGAITEQLAGRLKAGTIRLNSKVESLENSGVKLQSGHLKARSVVIATQAPAAAALLPELKEADSLPVTCLYFAAPQAPFQEPLLVLNGGPGLINNLAVLSNTASTYAPVGQSLISVTVLGKPDENLEEAVKAELKGWYGQEVEKWRHLRSYRIDHAQPRLAPGHKPGIEVYNTANINVYVCGDHTENASINGALVSGRRAAEAVGADLKIAVAG